MIGTERQHQRAPSTSREAAEILLRLTRGEPPGDGTFAVGRSVLDLAVRHQVAGLIHTGVLGGESRGDLLRDFSQEVRDGFKLQYLLDRMRNEQLAIEIAELHDALLEKGVPNLFLKGPSLAFDAYPDPGARPVGDIDLCVPEGEFHGASEVLLALGYAPSTPLPRSPAEALHRAHYSEQLRFNRRGRRMVELHFRLINFGPPRPEEQWVWAARRALGIRGREVSVPSVETTLLHLLLHANQHAFSVLRLLFDVRFALERAGDGFRSEDVASRIAALRCGCAAYHSLLLASELAGAVVPEALLRSLRPGVMRRSAFRRLWRLQRVRRLAAPRPPMRLEAPLFYLLEVGRPSEKLRYLTGIAAAAIRSGLPR